MPDTTPVSQSAISVAIASKTFRSAAGEWFAALAGLGFEVRPGEVCAIVGPSGCGKTTLLRILAGLDADFEGRVVMPAGGRLAVVFQEPRLLPWRTVEANVRLAAPEASDALIDQLFEVLGLAAHRQHFPSELSLGLSRRVALARAFAVEPDVLLLDEPFVSLDTSLAERLRQELAGLVVRRQALRPVTTLLVTHDIDEAIELADRILVLSARPARVLGEVVVKAGGDAEDVRRQVAVLAAGGV